MVLEEGIPPSISIDLVCDGEALPQDSYEASQVVVHQPNELPITPNSGALVTSLVPQDNVGVLADLA